MISVLSAVAEIEREKYSGTDNGGRRQKARDGKWNGGFAPYGYKPLNGELKLQKMRQKSFVLFLINIFIPIWSKWHCSLSE